MAPAAPTLLPGQSAPITLITSTDKSGVVLIVTALGLAFVLVSVLIRIYVRYEFSPNRFSWDDGLLGGAVILSAVQSAVVFIEVHKGFGKTRDDVSPQNLIDIQKATFADDILYILSLWLTKVSVGALFLRLSPVRSHVLVSKTNILLAIPTAIISILIVSLRCNLSQPWININQHNAQCTGLLARWQTVAAFDIALEILLFATSVFIVYPLQMTLYWKLVITSGFALRLPIIIPTVFRLHYLSVAFNSANPTLVGVTAVVCKQTEIAYAIISATIPCLRPFMTATSTNYGAPAEGARTTKGIGYSGGYGHKNSYNASARSRRGQNPLSNLTSKLRSMTKDRQTSSLASHSAGTFEIQNSSNMVSASGDTRSIGSGQSTQMIILKNVSYTVEDENR